MITLNLPRPPSMNQLWRGLTRDERNRYRQIGKKPPTRFRTKRYETWARAAGNEVMIQRQKRIEGPVRLVLEIGATFTKEGVLTGTRPDISNLLKATEDLLVNHGLITDDKHILHEELFWTADVAAKRIVVRVKPMETITAREAA